MADIDSLLLAETGGACAYCGTKDYRVLSVHHIEQHKPKDESYDNKIILCHNCHHLHHEGKGPSRADIMAIKKRLIQQTLTQQGVNAIKESRRKGFVVAAPYLVNHLVELGFFKQTDILSTVVTVEHEPAAVIDAVYELTEDGTALAKKWGLN